MLKKLKQVKSIVLIAIAFFIAPFGVMAQSIGGVQTSESYHPKFLQIGHQVSDSFTVAKYGDSFYLRNFTKTDSNTNILNKSATIRIDLNQYDYPELISIQYVSSKIGKVVTCESGMTSYTNNKNSGSHLFRVERGFGCYYTENGNFYDVDEGFFPIVFVLEFVSKPILTCQDENAQIKSLSTLNASLRSSLSVANSNVSKLEANLKASNTNLSKAKATINDLEKEVKRLKALLAKK